MPEIATHGPILGCLVNVPLQLAQPADVVR